MNTDDHTFNRSEGQHVLLSVLGTNRLAATYSLKGRQTKAQLAPIALLDLLPQADRPGGVLAVCTPEAKRESWPTLEQELNQDYDIRVVDVPAGHGQEDIDRFLANVTNAVPSEADLTVDVTHGYRHFSFLTYIAVLYLAALRGVRVRGAYYGLLRRGEPSPFLDLRPLLKLPRWLHALNVLRDTGSTAPLAAILGDGPQNQSTRKIKRELSQLSQGYLSGLPIELGRQAHDIRKRTLKPLIRLLKDEHHLPLAVELVERLDKILEPHALITSISDGGWKRHVTLSRDELERQVRIIDQLLDHKNTAAALGLMNEWTVSWVVWRLGWQGEWLDYYGARRKAGNLLGAMMAVCGDPELSHLLTDEQRELGRFWNYLSSLRNGYHHHGMRRQDLIGDKQINEGFDRVTYFWRGTLCSFPDFSLSLGDSSGGRVLVSPIGNRPGVLFSAFHACSTKYGEPTTWLVVCSSETEKLIPLAATHSGYGGTVVPLRLEDPYGGISEIEPMVKAVKSRLVGADEVIVNITGGTTLMGLAAERLADTAGRLARPVRRFGLIDRRSPQEQEAEPYRLGEPFWLNDTEGSNADNDSD